MYVPYTPTHADLVTAAQSSIDCVRFPDTPGCKGAPDVDPVKTDLFSCTPKDGKWSEPHSDDLGRSRLLSPCCQPPDYKLATNYKTCDDNLNLDDHTEKCIAECCNNAAAEANNYDPSWYPMARCACSMWCYNKDVPHFKKYGTAVHYITGDLAEAQTSDSGDFIGGSGYHFSGQ
jgi:hypothetical protein